MMRAVQGGWVSNCNTPPCCQISLKANCSLGRSRPATVGKLLLLRAQSVHYGKETVDTGHSQHSLHMFYVAHYAVVGHHCSNKNAALLSAAQTVHDGKDAQKYNAFPRLSGTDYLLSLPQTTKVLREDIVFLHPSP